MKYVICILILLGFVGAGLGVHFATASQAKKEEKPAVAVVDKSSVKITPANRNNLQLQTLQKEQVNNQLDVMGKISVTEDGTTMISSRVQGRIDKIMVASGEPVVKGQLLAYIFSPDFAVAREEYLQSSGRKKGADADFTNLAALSYKKLQTLGLGKEDIANIAKTPADNLPVHAPVDGVIIVKNAMLGASVNSGDPLFTLGDLHKVWFLGDVYPEDLEKVRSGQEVIIDGTANTGAIHGRVSFISPLIDPNTRTIKIRVLMENPNQELRSDMYVQAHIIMNQSSHIAVPEQSVFNENNKNYVFRQDAQDKDLFHKVEVTLGSRVKNLMGIQSGLAEGDTIVTEGGLLLNATLDNDAGN